MSLQTKQEMEAAIAAHFAGEMDDAILTGYWLVAKGSDLERPDTTSYFYVGPDSQPFHESLGLSAMGSKYLDQDYRDSKE